MRDEEGARSRIRLTRVAVLFLFVTTLASLVLLGVAAAHLFAATVGGIDAAVSLAAAVRSERPHAFGGFLLFGLAIVGYSLFLIVGFVRQLRRAFDERIHVEVTDAGITVRREGNRYWQSSGVEIPFDAITAVEYLDPDESSIRIERGDWRAQRFFAGRSENWIRIERSAEPAVYVGSDRPMELAETIVQRSPAVESADPF